MARCYRNRRIRDVAWKAQLRLASRFARLRGRGVQINKVCVAVARELAGFVWAIASTQAKLTPNRDGCEVHVARSIR
jgi:transposase